MSTAAFFSLITSAAQLIMITLCNYLAEGAGGMRPIVAPVCSPGMKMDGLMIGDNQAGVRRHSSGPSVSTQRRRSLTADSVLARRLLFTNPVIKASAGVENGLLSGSSAVVGQIRQPIGRLHVGTISPALSANQIRSCWFGIKTAKVSVLGQVAFKGIYSSTATRDF